jgi:DNA-binding NarL/FixJ family response regulator
LATRQWPARGGRIGVGQGGRGLESVAHLGEDPPEQLVAAVRAAAAGDALIAPTITKRLIEQFTRTAPPSTPPPALQQLTPREVEVLTLISRGLSNGEIASELVLSEATVKTHVKRLLSKLSVRDRVQAVVRAWPGS